MNLSFAGCGFLGIYHVGVAVCFKKYAPHLLLGKISGASFGAISACALLCDIPIGMYRQQYYFWLFKKSFKNHSLKRKKFLSKPLALKKIKSFLLYLVLIYINHREIYIRAS